MEERKETRKVRYFTEEEHRALCSWVNYGYYGDRPACEGEATHFIGERESYVYQQMGFCDGHWKTFRWGVFKELAHNGDEPWMAEALMSRIGDEYRRRQDEYVSDQIRQQVADLAALDVAEADLVPSPELPRNGRQPSSDLVYFIQAGDGGAIKIGTTTDIEKRMAALQTAHHVRLRLLAVQLGGVKVEREYHRIFFAARLEGEWFEPVPKLLATIDAIKAAR